jgi:hypothetical protein
MILHRSFAQSQHLANLTIAESARHQTDDLALALGQRFGDLAVEPCLGASLKIAQQRFSD